MKPTVEYELSAMEVNKTGGGTMNMPMVEITHQNAQIEVHTQRARVEINSQRPHFTLYRNRARMSVNRRRPVMHMDRSQRELAMSRGPFIMASRQNYEIARQDVTEAIGNIAAEGTALMSIENPGNTVAAISAAASAPKALDINISSLPRVEIDWDPGYMNIDWTPGALDFQWDVNSKVDIRVEPSYVEIRLARHPEIKIKVVYKNEAAGGKVVDKYL